MMRDLLRQLRRAATMPPGNLAAKVRKKVRQRSIDAQARGRDLAQPTYLATMGAGSPGAAAPPLARLIGSVDVSLVLPHQEVITGLAGRALAHEFDLLGSGWVRVENTHGLQVADTNRAESERIAALLPAGYTPIDWHVDFKSKQRHRWDPLTWYRDQPQVVGNGVDVKLPWELSRMQHLPLFAWGYALANAPGVGNDRSEPAECYRDEFRNEVLDFIAQNPPRFGINWNCAMDVGIRVAGWVLTFDLFRAAGGAFDDAFLDVFTRSVREHADHLAANLEWDDHIRGNHYLADVAGLLIASAYLPADEAADRYLHFAARELVAEVLRQFHHDGSNFEASTSYHRLSAEMAVYGLAVLQGATHGRRVALAGDQWYPFRPGTPPPALAVRETNGGHATVIPPEVIDRVARMGRFTEDLLDRHGRDPQIGDNDNGRFFKLLPATMRDADGVLHEDTRNHRHLIDAVDGFFPETGSDPVSLESGIVRALLGGVTFPRPGLPPFVDHIAYPGMGLYLYRYGRLTTIVRCGEVGQNGHGGHAHDDQLSFVLYADGEPIVIDPGTGCYTSDPDLRNKMRHVARHNAVSIDHGAKRYAELRRGGLFSMRDRAMATALGLSPTGLVGQHVLHGKPIRRELRCWPDDVEVVDQPATLAGRYAVLHLSPDVTVSRGSDALLLHVNLTTLRLTLSHDAPIEIGGGVHSASYGAPLVECPRLTYRLFGPGECVCKITHVEPAP